MWTVEKLAERRDALVIEQQADTEQSQAELNEINRQIEAMTRRRAQLVEEANTRLIKRQGQIDELSELCVALQTGAV